jgi:hypothetical protein
MKEEIEFTREEIDYILGLLEHRRLTREFFKDDEYTEWQLLLRLTSKFEKLRKSLTIKQ